jgi:dynein heavy chain
MPPKSKKNQQTKQPKKKKSLAPTWRRPTCTGELPTKRSGHTFTLLSEQEESYMFGGMKYHPTSSNAALTNDLYRLKLMPGGDLNWSKAQINGKSPPPTWRHTANAFDEETKIIIFGGFNGGHERNNRVYVLNTEEMTWERPVESIPKSYYNEDDSEDKDAFKESQVPVPRGSHSSVIVNNELVIFGGYGGNGFERTDFNDLHGLDLSTWKWRSIESHGIKPEIRSGHTANLINDRFMFVVGGWNSLTQFQDVHILDTNPTDDIQNLIVKKMMDETEFRDSDDEYEINSGEWVWSTPLFDIGPLGVPRSVHSAFVTMSVPNCKLFVYGGHGTDREKASNNMSIYSKTVQMLECKVGIPFGKRSQGIMRWETIVPEIMNDDTKNTSIPHGRADTETIYDNKNHRMLLFGGWANRWFSDTLTLGINGVVGPPYAVFSIFPSSGPVHGGTECVIHGAGFVDKNVKVRFTVVTDEMESGDSSNGSTLIRKKEYPIEYKEGTAKFINENTINVTTPDFRMFQHKLSKNSKPNHEETIKQPTMKVTVTCGNQIYSITSTPYNFFFSTQASKCIIFGPALLNGVVCGENAQFCIQTRDSMGNVRSVGGDKFIINARLIDTVAEKNVEDTKLILKQSKQSEADATSDGTYKYNQRHSC